jgi:hypothetical protein
MTTDVKRICPSLRAALKRTKRSGNVRSLAAVITTGFCLCFLAAGCTHHQAVVLDNTGQLSSPENTSPAPPALETHPADAPHPQQADFQREPKSRNAQLVADWVVDSGDNGGLPFVIIDKMDAKVFVFNAEGRLSGAAPVLLGLAKGDDSAPGIGDRKLSDIPPEQRTTPAGRFVASLGLNYSGKDILWVDYDNAISLHRVITTNPRENRLGRLASPTPLEKRISFGCINVPEKFYNNVVNPTFTGTAGIVYILPETRSISDTFASYYDVESHRKTDTATNLEEETTQAAGDEPDASENP